MAYSIPEGYEEIEDEEAEVPEGYEPIDEVEGSPGFLWRNEIMSELDDDPETRRLAMQMLDTEGGGAATMEALVNRTAMIREKVPGWTINDELNSGFYGPINRGYAQTVEIDPSREARYQQDIDAVRAGSNVIQGRTDQGYPGDPNWRGPGRVHVPENPEEVYNYWTGKRAGVHFTHEDSAEFANKVASGEVSSQPKPQAPEGYEEIAEIQPSVPEGYEEIPVEGKKPFFATEEEEQRNEGRGPNYPPELKAEEQQATVRLPSSVETPGLIQLGNIDLDKRPVVTSPEGVISTERSISITQTEKGKKGAGQTILIPTVINGKVVDNETAIKHYEKTGEHLGIFKDTLSADEYAQKLHLRQEAFYTPAAKQARVSANREKLQSAIAKVEKEGYMVPHFIGAKDEPEGDRAPTRDMEQLVGALARQQTNAVRARDLKEAARIGKERAFWEEKIKTEGMTAEQWKKQTGEEDPRYPHEPAYTAKQSPGGLIDSVETGIKAGKEVWESGKRGLMSAGLGLGETINRYAYSPIVHGIREAIDYVAPGSDLAKTAQKLDDEFYKNTVEIPAAQRAQLGKESTEAGTAGEVAHAVGQMAGDLPSIMLTSGLLPELKTGIELINTLRHGAAAMTVPAMRAGTDAAEQVKKAGGNEWQQLGAWVRATAITAGVGSIPMATKSGAASMAGRIASRSVQSVPLASAAVESGRMLDNAASDLFGGEKRPFSIGEHLKQVAPLVLVGGVAGRDTRPSKFERTFGFSPVHLDKADWMRRRMEAEGLAKATPEKVMEWDAEFKKQEGEWPEEAPPVPPKEASAPAIAEGTKPIILEPINVPAEGPHKEGWHGTSADIAEFSTEFMGAGTGGQAQGWGNYIAEQKGTATYYRDVTATATPEARAKFFEPGKIVPSYGGYDRVIAYVPDNPKTGESWYVRVVEQRRKPDGTFEDAPGAKSRTHFTSPDRAALKAAGIEAGNIYKVKVLGDKVNYLDWDKPISKQSEDVQAAIDALNKTNIMEFKIPPEATGEQAYKLLEKAFNKEARMAGTELRGDMLASQWLHKHGVLGNRYLDADSRYPTILQVKSGPDAGKWFKMPTGGKSVGKEKTFDTEAEAKEHALETGTHNYVVFDPKNIRITDKNGKPVEGLMPKTPEPGPQDVKRSAQALGIVASPKAAKGFEQAREEAKAIADYLNRAEHWGPWNSAVGNNVAAEQKAYDNVMRQNKAWKKEAPDEKAQEGMTMYREADGDMRKIVGWGANVKDAKAKAAYRAAGALKPNELSVVQKVTTRLDALRKWLNANGIDVAEVENYVTHMFHTGGGLEPTTGLPKRSLSSYFKYAKPRKYPNYFAAIQAGEKPKSLNLIDIASAYEILAMRAVNNKKFIDRLKYGQARDGNPIVAPDKMEYRKLGYKSLENVPGLQRAVVHPDYYAPLGRIVGRSRIQEWLEERTNNPLLNITKGVLGGVAEAQKYTKGTMFSFSLFHQVTEGTHALGHRVNPFNLKTKEIDLNDPEQYDAAVHGLMLRPDRASQEQFIQGSGTTNYNLVTKVARKFGGDAGKGVADLIDGYTHYLFEDYIPRLKMDTYRHIVERNMARFAKDLQSGKTTTAAIKSLSADQANAAYGHLNYTKMARSKTVQHALQLAFLAPDFFEARARFAAQAGKGAIGLLTGSKTGTEQLIALANLAIGQYVAARILNQLDHGDPEWDTEHAFAVKTDLNGLLPDKRWISLRSVPEDIIKAGAGGLLKGDIGQAWKEAGRFGSVRLAAFPRVILEGLSGTNWRGEKTNLSKSLRDMVGNVVPMPMQGWADQFARVAPVPDWAEKWVRPDSPASISPGESLLKSMGVQIHRVSPINDVFEMKDEWLKVNDPEEYDRQMSSAFPASKYRGLRYALEDSDWEAARKEAKKLREGGATTETFTESLMRPFTGSFSKDKRFYDSLDKEGKALYDAAIRRRIQVLARYKEHVNPRAEMKRVTVESLHRRMREAEIEEKKNARKKKKRAL